MGIAAVLFAGVLDDDGYTWWPGIPAGIAAAWLSGSAVARPARARRRRASTSRRARTCPSTPRESRSALALLSLLAPPVGLLALGFFAWLLIGGRRRAGEKYAGPANPALTS